MKTNCSHGIGAEEGSEEAWRKSLKRALKAFAWKAGESSQGLCCCLEAVNSLISQEALDLAVLSLPYREDPLKVFFPSIGAPTSFLSASLLHSPICGVVGKGRAGTCVPLRPVSIHICCSLCWPISHHCL